MRIESIARAEFCNANPRIAGASLKQSGGTLPPAAAQKSKENGRRDFLSEPLADLQKASANVSALPGGSAIAVERYVNIVRHHYKEVNFIVPNYAYSAGTIFCMSGDRIYMDYYSVLGPIDPQIVTKDGKMVSALGYLDKVDELIKKSRDNIISQAEFLMLKEFDLAELRAYEQAKELTIDQLKKWLVQYKFKNWNRHKNNKAVTEKEKAKRAEEIAKKLSDSKIWKSHGRPINIHILENDLKLKIE